MKTLTDKIVVIVAGGRDFANRRIPGQGIDLAWHSRCWKQLEKAMQQQGISKGTHVIRSGDAKGADALGAEWAMYQNVHVQHFPANWEKYGKSAGHVRNAEMAKGAQVLIAFWDGISKGTKGMIDIATKQGIETHVYRYPAATP